MNAVYNSNILAYLVPTVCKISARRPMLARLRRAQRGQERPCPLALVGVGPTSLAPAVPVRREENWFDIKQTHNKIKLTLVPRFCLVVCACAENGHSASWGIKSLFLRHLLLPLGPYENVG